MTNLDSTVAAGTANLMAQGVRLLNFWRLEDSDIGHVSAAIHMLDLAPGARVVDLGSGIGEFARVAHDLRPDLHFTLVNISEWQLSQSPASALTCLGDMADTGLPSGNFDAVILAYALGHGDVVDVLEEAYRLLKPGGQVFLHDIFAADHTVEAAVKQQLNYSAHSAANVRFLAELIGFDVEDTVVDNALTTGSIVETVAPLLSLLGHGVLLLRKTDRAHRFAGRRVALHFSGGKDSLACLYLLRPFLAKYITVYWLNTGDGCPETLEVIDQVRQWVPNFIEVRTDVKAWRAEFGDPSDMAPASAHTLGVAYGMSDSKLVNRFDCCWFNLMLPMHARMKRDGVDAVIRGTKLCDTGTVPAEGSTADYDVILPIKDWSHGQVFDYLRSAGSPENTIYENYKGASAPECLTCTAWWDDGKAGYLRDKHPEQFAVYQSKLKAIKVKVLKHLDELNAELEV